MSHWLPRALALLFSAGMLCSAARSVCLACADFLARSDSPARLMHALRLAPGNSAWWLRLSELADPDAIARAVEADPRNASLWIRAAIRAEATGDRARAEQAYLRAAGASRKYQPRWALANFYFRDNDPEHFWPWMKSALEWAPGDRVPLFTLCWQMSQDPEIVLNRGIPDSPPVLGEYLQFLSSAKRLDAMQGAAARLLPQASRKERRPLLGYVNRMLEASQWQPALGAWNALCRRSLIPYEPLDASGKSVVTNGDFRSEPLNAGFDWRPLPVDGTSARRPANRPAWQIDFSGAQPASCEVLSQLVPVARGGRYRFQCRYETENIPSRNGLRWRILDLGTGAELASVPFDGPTQGGATLSVPHAVSMLRLVLSCTRPLGSTRIEGTLRLKSVAMEPAP